MSAYLIFEAASRRFALPAESVRQVLRMAAPAPVPGAPAALRGVLNVHGSLVPVIDVRARLGLPSRPLDPDAHLVLARTAAGLVALEVDRVIEVGEFADSAADAGSRWASASQLIAGAVKVRDGVALVQALDAIAALPSDGVAAP